MDYNASNNGINNDNGTARVEMVRSNVTSPLTVTSINDLVEYNRGSVVQLPSFGAGQPFNARIRRPSMLALVKNGKIPNSLLNAAGELFQGGMSTFDADNTQSMDNLFSILDTLCEASFVEPTYQQLKDAGIELTDEQYMFIFAYSQQGVKALESFREE